MITECDWIVTKYDLNVTGMWLNGYWNETESLLKCEWMDTEIWLNGYWNETKC